MDIQTVGVIGISAIGVSAMLALPVSMWIARDKPDLDVMPLVAVAIIASIASCTVAS